MVQTTLQPSERSPTDSTSQQLPISPAASEPASEQVATAPTGRPVELHVPQTPLVHITFLVISGRRRTMTFEPETTVGRVKELVWNAWPADWEDERPLAPSYLRILYLGKMLQDDDTLSELKFQAHTPQSAPAPTPTIVHLSIRPYAPPGDNDLKKKRSKNRSSDGNAQLQAANSADDNTGGGCCCVIC